MTTPSIGVAIPSFGQGPWVLAALESLAASTVPFEAVIQDGGSPPEVLRAIEDFTSRDDRFRLVVEQDEGQSDAINRAWRCLDPSHPYLTWLNTDDKVLPGGLEALVSLLEETPEAAVAYGDLDVIDEHGELVGWSRAPGRVRRHRLVHHHNLVPGIVPLIRASALERAGWLDPELHYAMDHDLFVRLAAVGQLRRVPVTVAAYRVHEDAKTVSAKRTLEQEVALVRARYRVLPRPIAELLRTGLRLAWWPTRRRYTRGWARRSNRDFGISPFKPNGRSNDQAGRGGSD